MKLMLFFTHFEKTAELHAWPKKYWALLIHHKFVGRARDAYAGMTLEQSGNYDYVKQQVLKGYQLVPEYYRQKFRAERKNHDQTHVELVRKQEQLFDQWLLAKGVGNDFDKLRQLMLLEQFGRCVSDDIKTHLEENKVETVQEAAIKADEYMP